MILSDEPLVYRIRNLPLSTSFQSSAADQSSMRTSVRALAGMQKEAIVESGATGSCWRLVCDEGPWLNGSDLAPFPLGFFTAGLAASCLSAFVSEAADRAVVLESPGLLLDIYFTMEGSAIRGTMVAGVQSVKMKFSANGAANETLADIAAVAITDTSPAVRCLTSELVSEFLAQINHNSPAPIGAAETSGTGLNDPVALFDAIGPANMNSEGEEIIRKLSADELPGGAVGLRSEQKRIVHVRTQGRVRSDGLKELTVQCIQPTGSTFQFLSDDCAVDGGQERAPSGLALMSCGVAFCFMTQIGRYAQITRQELRNYRITQLTGFDQTGAVAPVRTLVCLDTEESDEKCRELIRMGEQTCYLHAVYRTSNQPEVSFQVDL